MNARTPTSIMVTSAMIINAVRANNDGEYSMPAYDDGYVKHWVDVPDVLASLPGDVIPAMLEHPVGAEPEHSPTV